VSLTMSFVAALVPVSVCLAYIFALRQGKPPGYDRDCFEYLTGGESDCSRRQGMNELATNKIAVNMPLSYAP